MTTSTDLYQVLSPGASLVLGGKKFTVESIGDSLEFRGHVLSGARGAQYILNPYMPNFTTGEVSGLHYIVSFSGGTGAPLRDKSGKKIEVYVIGDIVSPRHV